jgi:hypothetical protein
MGGGLQVSATPRSGLTAYAASAAFSLLLACGGQHSREPAPQPSGEPQPSGGPQPAGSPQPTTPQPGSVDTILVWFKLDPRLNGGTYGGEIWVSPPTYTGATAQDTVEARARGIDGKGALTSISPDWIPSDPDMITVSPRRGDQVTITVKRAGESKLNVTSQGSSKELLIRSGSSGGAVTQVEISQ